MAKMKVRNLFSRRSTTGSIAVMATNKNSKLHSNNYKKSSSSSGANVAAFAQWSATRRNSSSSGGGSGCGKYGHHGHKTGGRRGGEDNNAASGAVAIAMASTSYPGPPYRTRATAETAFSDSYLSHDNDYCGGACDSGHTADLDDSSSTKELNEIRHQSELARRVLEQRAGEDDASSCSSSVNDDCGGGPATLSVSTGSLAETGEECYNSSYIEEYMESFINTIDPTEEGDEDVYSTGTDHSAYYSTADAILIMTGNQEDVSTLGGESRVVMRGDWDEGPKPPPIAELKISVRSDQNIGYDNNRKSSSDEGSVASEVTYGSCVTEEAAASEEDGWSIAVVKAYSDEKSEEHQDNVPKAPRSEQEQVNDMNLPLIAMTKQLERSKDDLARTLQDMLLNNTSQEEDQEENDDLKSSANTLLSECDALLMQLVTLSFKKHTAMIAKLQQCQEITLRECEDILVQLNELQVNVVQHWVDNIASSRSSNCSTSNEEGCCTKSSILVIQSFIRSQLQRKRYRDTKSNVKMIQGLVRGWLVRKDLPSRGSSRIKVFPKKRTAVGLDRLTSLGIGKRGEKRYLTLHEERMNKLRAEYFRLSQRSNTLKKNSLEYIETRQEMELIAKCIGYLHHQELLSNRRNTKKSPKMMKKKMMNIKEEDQEGCE